jgi:hypothetical protein
MPQPTTAEDLERIGSRWVNWNPGALHSYRELVPDPVVHSRQLIDEHLLAGGLLPGDDDFLIGGVVDFTTDLAGLETYDGRP